MHTLEPEDNGIDPVLVDSCIWGIALRKLRRTAVQLDHMEALARLIQDSRVEMIGPIRQEVLSGISDIQQFERLAEALDPFPNLPVLDADYKTAADISNRCRKRGIQGGATDFLICAVAARCGIHIYTVDRDFQRYRAAFPEFDLFQTGPHHWE